MSSELSVTSLQALRRQEPLMRTHHLSRCGILSPRSPSDLSSISHSSKLQGKNNARRA
ncbi:hypothetical protein K474DRAFT_1656766 [Panus rudis PR-1116 ss-1]|nr:hypothetical protein K474DRAFT_1662913 [Panus rudis PR-1116 ss-1]KAI0081269.1 hypothetical protein K474DRAFT_1656766 [Panus rudis PR-1116 ss-1]